MTTTLRIYLGLFLCIVFSHPIRADLGGCLIYKATYSFKDGQSLTAWLRVSGYQDYAYLDDVSHTNKYCSDEGFRRLVILYHERELHQSAFTVYTRLDTIRYDAETFPASGMRTSKCAFTDSASVMTIRLDDIAEVKFLLVQEAPWEYPEIDILITDSRTADLMRGTAAKNACALYRDPVPESPGSKYLHYFDYCLVLSFDPGLSLSDLKKEIEKINPEFYEKDEKWLANPNQDKTAFADFHREQDKTRESIIKKLAKQKIVLIRIQQTC